MAVAAVIAGVSAVAGLFGSRSASKAAKRAAAQEAKNEQIATNARILQIYDEERSLAGVTRTRAAGSGLVANQGSVLNILAEQAREFERERRTTKLVGASKASVALARGDSVAKSYDAQGVSNLFAGLSQAAMIASNAGLFTKAPPG